MVTHLKSLVLSIVMIFPIIGESTVVAARAPSSDPNAPDVNHVTVVEAKPVVSAEDDASRYLNAVREFADNVLKYGRDTYGPKHTPLFVDGLMVRDPNNPDYGKDGVFKPVEWIAPNGDRWILSNLASQQNLFRTLDALTTITGDPKYKQAAMDAIRYAFENLRSPNGLLYWGGHAAYDAGADKPCGRGIHELKANYPYYELMWEVDPQATKQFIEAFWSGHILDWSNLDMDRHCYNMTQPLNKPWDYEYKGGPVLFESKGVSFSVTGSDLSYAAAWLTKFTRDERPADWGERLVYRYVETRNPKTGISYLIFTSNRLTKTSSGDEILLKLGAGGIFPYQNYANKVWWKCRFGYDMPTPGVILTFHTVPWISWLMVGELLGQDGKEFIQWTTEELTARGKVAYRRRDNVFIPMCFDGTIVEGYVCKEDGPLGFKGTILEPVPLGSTDLWAYVLAYCLTEDDFMWQMARSIAVGNNYGDLGATCDDEPRLNLQNNIVDPYAMWVFLELYRKTKRQAFLEMARRIGDNILTCRFYKAFVVPSSQYTFTKFDCIDTLVLLHLHATVIGDNNTEIPSVWPAAPFFEAPYRGKDPVNDNQLIYTLKGLSEPPKSLQEAAAEGHLAMITSMIVQGVEIDSREDSFRKTALHRATISGYKDIAELLLAHGANPDARDNYAASSLHYAAAENGYKEIVELLINKSADINAENSYGDTPLQYAAFADNKEIIELLLQKGATIANLHIASYMGDLEKAEAFIDKGVDINALDGHGYAPMHYAVQNKQKEIIELLTAKGVDVNVKNWSGQTPLDIAMSRGYKDIAELLLSKGADCSIHTAASIGDVEKVKAFLEDGTDVNVKDARSMNALHYAAREGHKEIVELLLANGAEINAGAWYKRTAAEFAMRQNHTEIVELLVSKGADISPLHLAIYMKDETRARSLIETGADVNKQTPFGTTPLNMAIFAGFKDLVELLIDKGANVNAKDNWGWTALHSMVVYNSKDMVELLIANGADVNAKDVDGRIPLWYAEKDGHTEIAEILRKHGAKEDGEEEKKQESAPAPKEDKTTDPNAVGLPGMMQKIGRSCARAGTTQGRQAQSTSGFAMSITSKFRSPRGTFTDVLSPITRPRIELPMGDLIEMLPKSVSASPGPSN